MIFISEIGMNYNANFNLVYEMIRQSKFAGATICKFQLGWRDKPGEINQLDFDVVSIECSRSGGEIIEAFENIDFKRQIGLGVWDIHSPAIPTKNDMVKILKRALRVIPKSQFWINPDCGLKTRGWKETKESMKNMVEARKEILGE